MAQDNKLAKLENYLCLQGDGLAVVDILRENLQGSTLSPFDLDRVTVPSGGATTWEINDIDKGIIPERNLSGIIVHSAPARSYWAQGLDEGGTAQPPDCMSFDLVRGVGTPGGDCGVCSLNEWGSAKNAGRGKACSERRFLFMLRPDSYLPLVVQVPSSSVKAINQFFLRLAGKAIPYSSVVTNLSLKQATQGGGGLPYSQVVPSMAGRLSEEDNAKVQVIAQSLKPMFQTAAHRMAQQPNDEEFLND